MLLLLNCIKDSGDQGSSKNCGAGKGLVKDDVVDHVGVVCVLVGFFGPPPLPPMRQ